MNVLGVPRPAHMDEEELVMFEDMVGKFLDQHIDEATLERWRKQGVVDRDIWRKAGEAGLLGISMPAEYGGSGLDFRFEAVLTDQIARRGIEGWEVTLHNAIIGPYFATYGTEGQKRRWLPGICSGELVTAIAMTEPGTGSDLQAVRTTALPDGNEYVINGAKTFISNGQCADLIVVVCKTDPAEGAKGVSLFVVETDGADGFTRGRNLEKVGREASDTSELHFDNVRVPGANLLGGEEGRGFEQLMGKLPQERLAIAVGAIASIEHALGETIEYVKQRKAFGQRLIDFQNTQFVLAECKTEASVARVFVDHCVNLHVQGKLDNATASMAKYWVTDLLCSIIDRCLQLFGGYGYMTEYPIARAFKDARVTRIFGGTNEIMKLLIARSL